MGLNLLHNICFIILFSRSNPIIRDKSMDHLPHIGPRFPAKGR